MSTAAPTPEAIPVGNLPLPQAEQLPDDPETLKRMILELLATLREERRDSEALRHRLDLLLRRLYGPRSERCDPNQPLLFDGMAATDAATVPAAEAPASDAAASTSIRRRGKPHGRRQLPDHLPREPKHHELPEAERVCSGCGQVRIDIGVDASEQLDYRPASLFVIEHFVHKYACPHCAAKLLAAPPSAPATPDAVNAAAESIGPIVVSAPKPAMPIDKGLPGPGLLAHLIVSKYADHLPLYRLERIYERQGLLLPRSTTCDWLAACAKVLRPLYDLMVAIVLQSRVIHTDDTPIKIHDPPPGDTDKGRMWIYHGDAEHASNVFDFTPNRKRDGPQRFLVNYRGYLQADAFSGYDGLYLPDPRDGVTRIVEVACNAHARRKFHEARDSDAARAHQALAYFGQLYEIERRATAANADAAQRLHMRQDLAVPILDQFRTWLDAQRAAVLPKSPMAEAIGYALNQGDALRRYTEAGCLAIDNNVAEREMKRIAIGRKNWLFVGSEQGGHTAAVLFSFTSTCNRLGIEPWAYLQDVLTRLPSTPADQLAELLPDRWQASRTPAAAPAAATVGTPT